ncbi:MAG TPA: GYD domain-containing protein [Acidimicrobiales bacterium]|jgi:uncharacterized protein with GYD domain|nr:GYD domain-containing protein [Acidimicrobiales bacterium]
MSYRVVTRVTFTPEFGRLTTEEQTNEQIAAMEIVTRNGGTFESILVLPTDQAALTTTVYPDERSSMKAHLQIQARGAYELHAQHAFTLDEWTSILEESRAEAVVGV